MALCENQYWSVLQSPWSRSVGLRISRSVLKKVGEQPRMGCAEMHTRFEQNQSSRWRSNSQWILVLLQIKYGMCYGTNWCVGAAESEKGRARRRAANKANVWSTARKLIRPDGVSISKEYSDSDMKLQYKVEGGSPGFILEAHTKWKVEKKNDTECSIVVNFHGTQWIHS